MYFFPADQLSFRRERATAAVAMVFAFGCATRDRAPSATASPPAATAAPDVPVKAARTETPDAGSPRAPDTRPDRVEGSSGASDGGVKMIASVSSPCVLHAGHGKRHTHMIRVPGGSATPEGERGSCSANAECIASKGRETSGDGFVRLDCADRSCSCSIEPVPASGAKPTTTSFSLSSPCTTSGRALQLIVEQCMPGMVVVRH